MNQNNKNNNKKQMNKRKIRTHKRAGVSPVIGTTIIIAITVAMGLGLYSFTNSQTNVATKSFADEATNYINYKNDRFTITGLAFKTNNDPQQFTAYIFNNGERAIQIKNAILTDKADSSNAYSFCTTDGLINSKDIRGILFGACTGADAPVFSGFSPSSPAVYEVKISSENGVLQTYFQKYSQ